MSLPATGLGAGAELLRPLAFVDCPAPEFLMLVIPLPVPVVKSCSTSGQQPVN
jgi:hypothetical protein